MPDLGSAKLTLVVAGDKFKKGLATARKQTGDFAAKSEKQVGRVRGAFGKLGTGIKGAAGQVPILGGAMTALANPITAIAVGVGAVAVALGKMVGRIVDAEKALRPMVERSGLASDSLQLLAKAAEVAGSEDGLEGVTDSAQELQLRLAEVVQDGTGPAAEAFRKLGISAQDLIDKSPEEMLLTVLAALQNVTNEADRKFLADELLGGSSEKLAGLLNLTNEELADQLQHLADTGDFMSRDALDAAEEYSGGMDRLKSSLSSVSTFIGTELIKTLNEWIGKVQETIDGIKQLGRWLGITKKDTNEFTEAADEMSETLAQGAAPAFEDTTEAAEDAAPAVKKVGTEARKAEPKIADLTEVTDDAAESVKLWAAANRTSSRQMIEDSALRLSNLLEDYAAELEGGRALAEATAAQREETREGWEAHYGAILDMRRNARDRRFELAAETEEREREARERIAQEEADAQQAALDRLSAFVDDQVAEETRKKDEYAALLFAMNEAQASGDTERYTQAVAKLQTFIADNKIENDTHLADYNAHFTALAAAAGVGVAGIIAELDKIPKVIETAHVLTGGGSSSGRRPGDDPSNSGSQVANVWVDDEGNLQYSETFTSDEGEVFSGGGQELHLDSSGNAFYDENLNNPASDEAQGIVNDMLGHSGQGGIPGAQRGAAVRGSRYGSLVRVGENFTNENIVPVRRNGGMGGGRQQPMVAKITIGGRTLEDIWLEGQSQAQRSGRLD